MSDLVTAFELHDPTAIRRLLTSGVSAVTPIHGKTPIVTLVEMYTRSDAFPECLRLLRDAGAVLPDPKLEAVLLNDAPRLLHDLQNDPGLVRHRTTLTCCFTPLEDATLLHVAAEYGHCAVAETLLRAGADANAVAGDGQTPLFHTVNSNANRSRPVMDLLLDAGASVGMLVPELTWGRGFDWETTFFDVTPVSYCQFGLLPQMHRKQQDIAANVKRLLKAAGRPVPLLANVPNKYLK